MILHAVLPKSVLRIILVVFAIQLFTVNIAYSAVYISKTRLIVHEELGEETFQINNEGKIPVLLQIWLDTGNMEASPGTINVPFVVSPFIFRSEPGNSHAFRLLFTGDKNYQPKDREQVFWLNILEIPKKNEMISSTQGGYLIQLAFRSRIKVFYRPAMLRKVTMSEVVRKMHFSIERNQNGYWLLISNPGPLNITLNNLIINDSNKLAQIPQGGMIAPFSALKIPLKSMTGSIKTIKFEYLDDFGIARESHGTIE